MTIIAFFLGSTRKRTMAMYLQSLKTYIYTRFQGTIVNFLKKNNSHKKKLAGGHFYYWWKAEHLIRSSPYSWVTAHTKLGRSNNYLLSR